MTDPVVTETLQGSAVGSVALRGEAIASATLTENATATLSERSSAVTTVALIEGATGTNVLSYFGFLCLLLETGDRLLLESGGKLVYDG